MYELQEILKFGCARKRLGDYNAYFLNDEEMFVSAMIGFRRAFRTIKRFAKARQNAKHRQIRTDKRQKEKMRRRRLKEAA